MSTKYKINNELEQIAGEPFVTYNQANFFLLANQNISKDYIKRVSQVTKLTLIELMEILPISIDTYKRKTVFDSDVAEKILEIEEVYKEGIEAFGDRFQDWMGAENPALGNIKPRALLSNSFGIRKLLDQIGRIKHGILA